MNPRIPNTLPSPISGRAYLYEGVRWVSWVPQTRRGYLCIDFYFLRTLYPIQRMPRDCSLTLASRWTEPIILLLISFHLVVLSIQSARSLTLADSDAEPFRPRGYFHQWEDYALFSLFTFFTYANLHNMCH